jgi:hypothetical protein
MLVTFTSKASADITMFGDVAVQLLRLMGHSGTVPGAMQPVDLAPALAKLEKAVTQSKTEQQSTDPDDEFKPALSQRALPLISLLKAAISQNADVMWRS